MKKLFGIILCILVVVSCLAGCSLNRTSGGLTPHAAKKNIAVITAGESDEEFDNFCNGVLEKFTYHGYKVDKFATRGDMTYLDDLFASSLNGGYTGVILYDLNDYAEDFYKKASEAGVWTVIFSKVPFESEKLPVVCYDQEEMVSLSVDQLLELYKGSDAGKKTVAKIWCYGKDEEGFLRSDVFSKKMQENGIRVAFEAYEETLASGLSRSTKAKISTLPEDGECFVWVSDDDMANLVSTYLKNESINNAVVVSVGFSQKNLKNMFLSKNYWHSTSAVSYKKAGAVCADVLNKCFDGTEHDVITYIPSVVLETESLEDDSSIEVLEEISE